MKRWPDHKTQNNIDQNMKTTSKHIDRKQRWHDYPKPKMTWLTCKDNLQHSDHNMKMTIMTYWHNDTLTWWHQRLTYDLWPLKTPMTHDLWITNDPWPLKNIWPMTFETNMTHDLWHTYDLWQMTYNLCNTTQFKQSWLYHERQLKH